MKIEDWEKGGGQEVGTGCLLPNLLYGSARSD
jgi:hypothetical protein